MLLSTLALRIRDAKIWELRLEEASTAQSGVVSRDVMATPGTPLPSPVKDVGGAARVLLRLLRNGVPLGGRARNAPSGEAKCFLRWASWGRLCLYHEPRALRRQEARGNHRLSRRDFAAFLARRLPAEAARQRRICRNPRALIAPRELIAPLRCSSPPVRTERRELLAWMLLSVTVLAWLARAAACWAARALGWSAAGEDWVAVKAAATRSS